MPPVLFADAPHWLLLHATLYGGWLWWQFPSRRTRVALAGGALLVPLLWFGGDWIGSGRLSTPRRPCPSVSASYATSVIAG